LKSFDIRKIKINPKVRMFYDNLHSSLVKCHSLNK